MSAMPYDEAIADAICDALATSRRGLRQIVRELEVPISPATIYKWLGQNDGFRERYARAKEDQMQVLEDEMIDIADSPEVGEVVTDKGDKIEIRRGDMIDHRKLRIETRKWLMGKLRPKKYGDRVVQQHANDTGDGPPVFVVKSILEKEQ